MKLDSLPTTNYANIIQASAGSQNGAYSDMLRLDKSGGNYYLQSQLWDGTAEHFATSTTTLSTGQWYHVASVFDGVGHTLSTYLNGVATITTGATGVVWGGGTEWLVAGNNEDAPHASSWSNLAGTVDEVAIYYSALTGAQISSQYGTRRTRS